MSVKLRPLVPRDAPALAALHAKVNPQTEWRSPAAYASYALEILFRNPWVDPELPSWAAESNGKLVGVLGVVPRRMRFAGRTIRVAVTCQLMVDPDRRSSLVAVELLRKHFSGPQDLTLADGANDASRALWEASGGISSAMHGLRWIRLLRPAQGLLQVAGPRARRILSLAKPFAMLLDACIGPGFKPHYREAALDAATLSRLVAEQKSCSLRPEYDPASLEWLLAQAKAKRRSGELHSALLRDRAGAAAGWFLYYLNDAVSPVLQVGARRGALSSVLDHLAHHARARGARAIEGRMEPALAVPLQGKRALMVNGGICTLLHARDQNLLVPFLRGDAFFSRLEGEWWMRFAGDAGEAAPRSPLSFPLGLRVSPPRAQA